MRFNRNSLRNLYCNAARYVLIILVLVVVFGNVPTVKPILAQRHALSNLHPFPNGSGILQTFSATGDIDLTGPFFQSLGTNGRACSSCHQPDQDWTISAQGVQQRFNTTKGMDPIFSTNDGSNCDHNVDGSNLDGRKQAFSLLTSRGLIRIALPVPTNAEFVVENVMNPYGCSETNVLSMYRRPLPSTN